MKIKKAIRQNIIFLILITLLIIPQTRKPIQVVLHKGLALFGPSVIKEKNRTAVNDYNWNLKSVNDNNTFNFNQTKGKVVLVNFWATWCPPCIAEMPSMQKLYTDYKDKIEFVFISNENAETIQRFFNKKEYSFNAYTPISSAPEPFNVTSIPRTFLLDKTGRIVIDKTGASNWNSHKVRSLIDELRN